MDTTRQPISTTHHSDFDGHFCTPRSVSLQPLLRLMYLGYRFRWPNSRGAPLCIENYDVSSMHFGASNKTEYRTNVESDRLFSTSPTWTTKFTIELQNHPKWLKNCNIFLLQQVHRFNNRNFNFNSKYSKCNHQLNRKHFTVKCQVLPWFLAASMLSQLKQRRLQADTAMVNAAMAVAGWRTALDIGASSEVEVLKFGWSSVEVLKLHFFFSSMVSIAMIPRFLMF